MTDRFFHQTLSIESLEVLALVGDAGATPVRHGLLDCVGPRGEPGSLPAATQVTATTFQFTPLARSLRQDRTFSRKALGASLGAV
jgi:hypothetical protein